MAAEPFPHVVIDGLVPEDLLDGVIQESPKPHEREDWLRADRTDAIKLSISKDWTLGPTTRHLLNQFNSAVFIDFLERLTGMSGLLPDPHYFGGGLHQIERGGFLKIHADFNLHGRLLLDRRINVLVYLNHDWRDEWGGHLELWERTMTRRMKAITPSFNRMVIFATTDTSYHGHPDPLRCPPDIRRRSLALYYYSNGRPAHEQSEAHSTLHQVRPGEDFHPGPPAMGPVGARSSTFPEDLYTLATERNALQDQRNQLLNQNDALTRELDRDLYRTARRLRQTIGVVPFGVNLARRSLRTYRSIHRRVRARKK